MYPQSQARLLESDAVRQSEEQVHVGPTVLGIARGGAGDRGTDDARILTAPLQQEVSDLALAVGREHGPTIFQHLGSVRTEQSVRPSSMEQVSC